MGFTLCLINYHARKLEIDISQNQELFNLWILLHYVLFTQTVFEGTINLIHPFGKIIKPVFSNFRIYQIGMNMNSTRWLFIHIPLLTLHVKNRKISIKISKYF